MVADNEDEIKSFQKICKNGSGQKGYLMA